MHVFLITQYFAPEIGAASSRWSDYVKLLVKKGHKVTVLCQTPNYPDGKIFEGYKNHFFKKDVISDNLNIIRSGVWVNDRSSAIKIVGNYLSFAFTGLINSFRVKKYDLIIVSSPPLFIGIIPIILKKLKKCTIFLDLRDIWPESVIALGGLKSKLMLNLGRFLEKKLYNSVNGFIFPVPGFSNYFCKSFPNQMQKPMFNLMNGINNEFLKESLKHNNKNNSTFKVLYSGNLGLAQGLEVIIKVAELLIDYPIKFEFIGSGVKKESLINLVKLKNLTNITFKDSMPRNELIKELRKANVCLVPLKNKKLFINAIPSKIFEIMACNKPIILGLRGESEVIVKDNNCGIVVEPENPEDYKNAILAYYKDESLSRIHGQNGVNYVTNFMQKELLLSNFLNELKNKDKKLSLNINI